MAEFPFGALFLAVQHKNVVKGEKVEEATETHTVPHGDIKRCSNCSRTGAASGGSHSPLGRLINTQIILHTQQAAAAAATTTMQYKYLTCENVLAFMACPNWRQRQHSMAHECGSYEKVRVSIRGKARGYQQQVW